MWDTYHVIGPDSPLAPVTPELLAALREGNCASLLGGRITVIFSGVDTFMVRHTQGPVYQFAHFTSQWLLPLPMH